MTGCPIKRGVHLGRLKMYCIWLGQLLTVQLGEVHVHLWEVKNVVFVCVWDYDWVSTKGVCLFVCDWNLKGGVHSWELKNVVFVHVAETMTGCPLREVSTCGRLKM